ncbi:hypothetical protein [Thiolapillus sp.]|uniref:hypothetical protein n=1 Tax=Thiolapillus sp. TaxID=2017437 RepID=UPI003AF7DC13
MDQEICLLLRQTDNSGPPRSWLSIASYYYYPGPGGGGGGEGGLCCNPFFFSFSFRAGKGCSDFCNTRPVKAVEKNLVAVQVGQGCREKEKKERKKKKKKVRSVKVVKAVETWSRL